MLSKGVKSALNFHIVLLAAFCFCTAFLTSNLEDIELNQLRTLRATKNALCYRKKFVGSEGRGQKLQDIQRSSRQPTKGRSIFFHVTECNPTGELSLSPREFCAIESAAFNNPSADVFVLFAAPTHVPVNLNTSSVLGSLLKYKNIFLRNCNISTYAKGTPVEGWFRGESIFRSDYLSSHLSDFLRLVTLWRYGGVHVNLDVLTLNDLFYFPQNSVGALDNFTVSNAVINIGYDEEGRRVATTILKHFVKNFRGDSLDHNGDNQLTAVIRDQICEEYETANMTPENCGGLDVYPSRSHYPIEKHDAHYLFDEKYIGQAMEVTHFTFTVRFWDEITREKGYEKGKVTAFRLHAYANCPRVFRVAEAYL